MILTALMFIVAMCLSAVAAFYSIVGLTAIFAAAVIPIVLMGSILEVAKLVVTVWLHEHWDRCKLTMKLYLVPAVGILMLITSMGIFGFLSKAHSDQSMISGDVLAKISVYDEKIKTAKDNIDANRKALKQMDEAVDQVMGRSQDEKGADKAVAIRRTQQKERARLQAEIAAEQKIIGQLSEERAPIAAEVRKVEAEVGPIKYIAALVYGDSPEENLLERAVRWVIIILVSVFDPLAVMMLLAATESRRWAREDKNKPADKTDDDPPLVEQQPEQIKETTEQPENTDQMLRTDPSPPGWMYSTTATTYPSTEQEVEELKNEFDRSKHAYLDQPFAHFKNLTPMVHNPESEPGINPEVDDHDDEGSDEPEIKAAKNRWKSLNPTDTLKGQRQLLARGMIKRLPWEAYLDEPEMSYGKEFPEFPIKGDMFVNTVSIPTRLYKHNGDDWIEVDKTKSDTYSYNSAYITSLINRVSSGEYDPELLTDSERLQIEQRLRQEI
jgi:hypothetical protein